MRGDKGIIKQLNAALGSELTAIVQYMVQSEMQANWGYKRLSGITKTRAIEEMKHAEGLIERIIFLDGTPTVDVALTPQIGANVKTQFEIDLKDETDAVRQYNASVEACAKAGDNGTRELFESMIQDEERHADYLETQLSSIQQTGIANFLSEQMKES